ncbi:MAG TPA: tetratricopeptide repeat protein [Candidatus Acidoferrales bacterium]|nr:tetratricopeptide repeat protein [Candidatus Acidoferrales bacterium]
MAVHPAPALDHGLMAPPHTAPPSPASSDDRLDSWKEIAAFLKRGVRTVQRWERTEALPVHRHQHAKLGSVYALKSEVSAWWDSRGTHLAGAPAAASSAHSGVAPGAASRRSRLLVLPFANLSGDAQQEYLSDGLTEEMIARLARLEPERLGVIARTTAMSYRPAAKRADQIARELGVDYILEGSVRAHGTALRVNVQLVDAREHTHLWAESYERELSDVFALQSELAGSIAREVRLALPRPEGSAARGASTDPEAYKAFLMGRFLMNKMTAASLAQSLEWFERAVKLDPALALAHAGLAQAYGLLASVPFDALPPREAMPKAAAAARKALELDSSLPEAHAALGLVLHHYEWNWAEAEKAYQRALELNPDYTAALLRYAWLLLALGRHPDALARLARAQEIAEEIDPHLIVVVRATRAAALYFARDFARAAADCREALSLDRNDFLLQYLLGHALLRGGRVRNGIATLLAGKQHAGEVPLMAAGVGLALALSGKKKGAAAILRTLEEQRRRRYIPALYPAILCAALGDDDRAFTWFETALEERADGMVLLNADPMSDRLRHDPRFDALVQRVGFVRT